MSLIKLNSFTLKIHKCVIQLYLLLQLFAYAIFVIAKSTNTKKKITQIPVYGATFSLILN